MGMNNPSDYAYFYNSDGGDRIYDSDSMCDWLTPFFTTGVFNGSLQVLANDPTNLGVTVQTGFVNIEGKVKHFYQPTELTLDIPHSMYDRIDTIVVQRNDTERDFIIKVVKGEASSTPEPTPPVREGVIYELVLAEVYVRAGESEITQLEITDKRMFDDVCGWVATAVTQISFDQIAAQFRAFQLHNQKVFMDWFNSLVYVLDGDVAGHLQNEIDNIVAGGSIIVITTEEPTLLGQTVTITAQDGTEYTGEFDGFGNCKIDGVTSIGDLTITSTDGEDTATTTIHIDYFSVYTVSIAFWSATINLSTSSTEFFNQVVTVEHDNTTESIRFDNTGHVTYKAHSTGVYEFYIIKDGSKFSTSVNVTEQTTYSATLSYWRAVVNISTTSEVLFGAEITITSPVLSDAVIIRFDQSGLATYIASKAGTYTFTTSYQGDYVEETLSVTSQTAYSVELSIIHKYGVEWDGTASPVWSRTDEAASFADPSPAVNNGTGSSPFDTISPWKDMAKVENSAAGTLVKIPKYYYKWTRNGTSMKLQIAMKQFNGSHVSPAHADRGDGNGERDFVYVGRYHCTTLAYKSETNYAPKVSETRSTFRTAIHKRGADIWQWDYAMYWTIMMLYLVEFANWDSQRTIGYGCSDFDSCGRTDAMRYHTGTNAITRDTFGHVQYRYIEDLWGNAFDFCDGIYFSSTNIYCIKNPADFSDNTGGTLVGTRAITGYTGGFIRKWTDPSSVPGFEYALYPCGFGEAGYGSGSTYVCDFCDNDGDGVALYLGGNNYQSTDMRRGAFYIVGRTTASDTYDSVSSRLMKLPNNS